MIFLLAGNEAQANGVARWLELKRTNWKYIMTGEEIRGMLSPSVLACGNPQSNPNYKSITEILTGTKAKIRRLGDQFQWGSQ